MSVFWRLFFIIEKSGHNYSEKMTDTGEIYGSICFNRSGDLLKQTFRTLMGREMRGERK